jgi:WD40 repeat protein
MAQRTGGAIVPEKSLRAGGAILCLRVLDLGPLAVIDSDAVLRFVDLKRCRVLGSLKLPLNADSRLTGIDIARKGNLCITVEADAGEAEVCSIKKRQRLYGIGSHRGAVSRVVIDPTGRYGVTAGDDGKVIAWDLKNGTRAFNLPAHSDGVKAAAFNEAGDLAATGGFDRVVQLSQPGNARPPLMLRSHSSAVTALCFAEGVGLVSGDRSGGLAVWDVDKGSLIRRLEAVQGTITALCCDEAMLFAATERGTIALYDLRSLETVALLYLRFAHPVTAMAYCPKQQRFTVGTASGGIHLFDLFGDSARLEAALERKDFDAIHAMARDNAAVRFSPAYKRMQMQWEELVSAIDALITGDRAEYADTLLIPFEKVRAKQKEVRAIRERLKAYRVFREHVENRRYAVAYDLAFKFPLFRASAPFKGMEAEWERSCSRASELLRDREREEEAVALLASFRGISEKTAAIRELLESGRRYLYFKDLVARRDWKKAWDIVRNHPQLQQTDVYRSLLDVGDRLFVTAQRAYAANDYKNAETACETLLGFPDYRKEAAELLERMKS